MSSASRATSTVGRGSCRFPGSYATMLKMGVLAASIVVALPAAADAKVSLMVGGIEKQIYLPAKLAEQLGYFKERASRSSCSASRPGSKPRTR